MGILWEKTHAGSKYQIRTAGKTRRLYKDGVCHSEYNPQKIVTGSVWDLLSLPAFFYELGEIKRILMLGIGGGASILQLHQLIEPDEIVGVELNPMHLYVARRFFDLEKTNINLINEDAVTWLESYDGPVFDMIIDDLFIEDKREPIRAVEANEDWVKLLTKNLNTNGVLVMNFVSFNELKNSACFVRNQLLPCFNSAFCFSMPSLDNRIAAFLGIEADNSLLRESLLAHPLWGPALRSKKLNYRIRQL